MKLSEDARRLADGLIAKSIHEIALWGEEDQRRIRASRTPSDPKFGLMTQHYEERIRRAFKGLINAYVEGYRMDEALMDDEDSQEIIEEVRRMIHSQHHHVTNSVIASRDFSHPHTGEKIPNMGSMLAARFERLLGEAAIELNTLRNQLVVERKQRERQRAVEPNNQINIYGHNLGPIQQGGRNNTQSVTASAEVVAKINELLTLVENSSLSQVQKIQAVSDIKAVHDLSKVEANPEVQAAAKSRLEGIHSVISLSADLVSLGIPIIEIIRAFFGFK